jgi:beta-aspartyl-peptidase (threonine type)
MRILTVAAVMVLVAGLLSCGGGSTSTIEQDTVVRPEWALVVHGGVGTFPKDAAPEIRNGYVASVQAALAVGKEILAGGGSSLDAVQAVLELMEDDPRFNAGKGAVFNHDGGHELDASIMNGADHACGAVTGVTTVRHPIRLARMVMEHSRHVLFSGAGAERFADTMEVERVANEWFDVPDRLERWKRYKEQESKHGTVGCAALDRNGDLAAGTSTGGLTGKRYGRVGDSPIVGAGTWADNATCAISCTGTGEEFIRHGVAQRVGDMMEYGNRSLEDAAVEVVHNILSEGDGGLIGLDHAGRVVMEFNTPGMLRGFAISTGRSEILIHELPEQPLD